MSEFAKVYTERSTGNKNEASSDGNTFGSPFFSKDLISPPGFSYSMLKLAISERQTDD
jgi:hypothetical protein